MIAAAFLASCSVLSDPSCGDADWRALGYRDGVLGFAPTRLSEHAALCRGTGAAANHEAWRAGYDDGLAAYCTPGNAAQLGANGQNDKGVCTGDRAASFDVAYHLGETLREKQIELALALRERDAAARTLSELQTTATKYAAIADDISLSVVRRDHASDARFQAFTEEPAARESLIQWETEVIRLEIDLETARRELDKRYPEWRR